MTLSHFVETTRQNSVTVMTVEFIVGQMMIECFDPCTSLFVRYLLDEQIYGGDWSVQEARVEIDGAKWRRLRNDFSRSSSIVAGVHGC